MIQERVDRVVARLKEAGISQMVITDPYSIYYLTEHMISPGERFLALLLLENGTGCLFVNRLFTINEDLGVDMEWYDDTVDPIAMLASRISEVKTLGVDKNMAARFLLPLMEQTNASSYVNASPYVDRVRQSKDAKEQERMRAASAINDKAMAQFKECIQEGMTETELADQFLAIYKSLGAEGFSFTPLVGFGECAAIGHYEPGERRLKKGDCILIDVGCEKDGYCSDMTRTFFYGEVNEHQKEVYQTVRRAQAAAEEMIKPGVRFCDIDRTARKIIEDAGYGKEFTHRLGHSIGIEVHEFGDVSQANTAIVEEGMTFSIEPGIYIEGDMGVRIEDLVLVTKDGVEILNGYTKELQVI